MNQSRLESLVETVLSTLIGLAFSIVLQMAVYPMFGWRPPLATNLALAAIFTAASITRGYAVRRFFNAGLHRVAVSLAARLVRVTR